MTEMTGQEPARSASHQAGASRGRGRPARISRERIVAAARQLRPEAITLQAIAKLLQVDPTTLKYHVGDREGLLTLVALDIFETELATTPIPGTEDWQDAIRSYARALHEAAAKLGPLALSIPLRASAAVQSSLAHVETVLEALVDAGFSTTEGRRILVAVSDLAFADVLDEELVSRNKNHPQVRDLLRTIDGTTGSFPLLRKVVADRQARPHDDGQFSFSIETLISGLALTAGSTEVGKTPSAKQK
jgi:TetR/AcrR family transcriptional regulator, tetracycline repressor protein